MGRVRLLDIWIAPTGGVVDVPSALVTNIGEFLITDSGDSLLAS